MFVKFTNTMINMRSKIKNKLDSISQYYLNTSPDTQSDSISKPKTNNIQEEKEMYQDNTNSFMTDMQLLNNSNTDNSISTKIAEESCFEHEDSKYATYNDNSDVNLSNNEDHEIDQEQEEDNEHADDEQENLEENLEENHEENIKLELDNDKPDDFEEDHESVNGEDDEEHEYDSEDDENIDNYLDTNSTETTQTNINDQQIKSDQELDNLFETELDDANIKLLEIINKEFKLSQ